MTVTYPEGLDVTGWTDAEVMELVKKQNAQALEDYMASPDTTPELLRQLHDAKVTYQAIASEVGVSYMTIYRWSRGFSKPRPAKPVNETLMFMCNFESIKRGHFIR
tara:strand:- start:2085 stop:2402 length:318 start_codon:yes stop_codon:yes gene_type:complete